MAFTHGLLVAQWPADPAPQQAASHRCRRAVQQASQAVPGFARGGLEDLQVAPRGGVDDDALVVALNAEACDMRQCAALGIRHVLQQRAGSADRQRQVGAAKAAQIMCPELFVEQSQCGVLVKVPHRAPRNTVGVSGERCQRLVFCQQEFRRAQALELAGQYLVGI